MKRSPRLKSRPPKERLVFGFLGDDVDVDGRRFAQEAMDCGEIEILAPVADRRATKDNLCDVFGADEFGNFIGHAGALEARDGRTEAFGKLEIGV